MVSLREDNLDGLVWKKGDGYSFVLNSPRGEFARLVFSRAGGPATAVTARGGWTFKRKGSLHPRVEIGREGVEAPVAVFFLTAFGGGRIDIGPIEYSLKRHGSSGAAWELQPEKTPIVRFEKKDGALHVGIAQSGACLDTQFLLILLGRYVLSVADEDAVMTAVMM